MVTEDVTAAARYMRITASNGWERLKDAERGRGLADAEPGASRWFAKHAAVYVLQHPDDLGRLTGPRLDVDVERLRSVLAVLACHHDATIGLAIQRRVRLRVWAWYGRKIVETR